MLLSSSFLKRTLFLALPVALQTLLQAMLGMADVSMVSGLGETAVASVGLAAKLHFLMLVLMMGIATAGGSLIAQFKGAASEQGMQKTLAVTLVTGIAINFPLMVLFLAAPWWINAINPDPEVALLTGEFLVITAVVLLFTQVTVIYEAALRSIGSMMLPLLTGILTVGLNIGFNYVFIFGHLGFEAMGVMGAAWGTLLARILQTLIMVGWLYLRRHSYALSWVQIKASVHRHALHRFAIFSLPLVLNYGLWGLGNTTYHVFMGYASTEALAVMGVMVPIESAFFAIFWGIASASAVLIGQALGADRMDEAKSLQRFFRLLSFGLVVVLSAGLWFAKALFIPVFDQLSSSGLTLLMVAITIFCLVVPVKVMNMVNIVGVLRAGGDNHFCLKVDTIVMWCIGLPIFGVAVFAGLGFVWLYFLLALEDIVKFIPFWRRLRQGHWLRNLTVTA